MVRRVRWEIMWDNCWIALASGNQKGGGEKDVEEEEGEDQRIQRALSGVGCGGCRGFLRWCEESWRGELL